MAQPQRDIEKELQEDIASFADDPYGFVMYAYPWGEEGTLLANETGPDAWQTKVLKDLGHALTHGYVINNGARIDCDMGIFIAVASGHGIGKSALMAMIDQWFISTHPYQQGVTTANTFEQLTGKTWREQGKWHKLLINQHWFKWTATKLAFRGDPGLWVSRAVPWSDRNPEAFAGTHERFVIVKYDEASSIVDIIWETTEGAMTESDGIKIWIVFGNPTLNQGRFTWCFGKDRSRWINYNVDSRDSQRTDKKLIEHWAKLYGDDSDFFRVRVKGQFPRAGTAQFIPGDIVAAAAARELHPSTFDRLPKILGIDIARFGDDQSVFITRQGLSAYDLKKHREQDSVTMAGLIAQEINRVRPDATFLDMGNIGAAIYDILIKWGYKVTGVWFGGEADDDVVYFNKRAEMWGGCKDWLKAGGSIPDDTEIKDDLTGPQYGFTPKEQIQIEAKKDMKSRGLASSDCADALNITFAYPVGFSDEQIGNPRQDDLPKDEDYHVFRGVRERKLKQARRRRPIGR